jgi:hypothetical protein
MEFVALWQALKVVLILSAIGYGIYSLVASIQRSNAAGRAHIKDFLLGLVRFGALGCGIPSLLLGLLLVATGAFLAGLGVVAFGVAFGVIISLLVGLMFYGATNRLMPCPSCGFKADKSGRADLRVCPTCGTMCCSRCNNASLCQNCKKWGVETLQERRWFQVYR